MVVKIDRDEAFADWRLRSALLLLALLGALAALVAIGGLLLWQRQEKAHFRALYQAEAATRPPWNTAARSSRRWATGWWR